MGGAGADDSVQPGHGYTGASVVRAEDGDVPFGEDELERVFEAATARNERLGELLLIDAWTGLRWSELRAIRVRDFVEVPMPILIVQIAAPKGSR